MYATIKKEALVYLENNEFKKAAEAFLKVGEKYQAGFCYLLAGEDFETHKLWYSECPDSPALQWGKSLLDLINLSPTPRQPTFLQIRNFLEMDIGYLIKANKLKYAENILKNSDFLLSINLETYKLLGRVLLNFGYHNLAKNYLNKSVNVFDKDPETYFYLAQLYYQTKAYRDALRMLSKSIELNNYYVPAIAMLEKVRLKMSSI